MSTLDFYAGRQAANFSNGRAVADASMVAHDWKNFSDRLKGKLEKTEVDFARAEAGRSGLARLLKNMTEELKRLDPNNPLVREELQNQVIASGAADKFSALGYDYDARRGSFRKRGS